MKELVIKDNMDDYLSVSKYINWKDNSILSKADEFKQKYVDEISLIKAIYEFVRDEIKHSWDVQDKRVTKSATEVLEQGVGWRGCGEKGTLLHCWWECKLVQPLWRTVWRLLKKLEIELPYDPAVGLLGHMAVLFPLF